MNYEIRMPWVSRLQIGKEWGAFRNQHGCMANYSVATSWDQVRDQIVPVNHLSSVRMQEAVYKLALYAKREMRFDFTPWGVREDIDPNPGHQANAFLWLSGDAITFTSVLAIGAVCFRWREEDAPLGWAMRWAWMHPYERGCGNLSGAWPFFRHVYGDFVVERPLSRAMEGFLKKQSDLGTAR